MKKLAYLLILVLAVTLSSCHSSKHGVSGSALENAEARAQYEALVARSFDFDQLQGKVKYNLGGKNLSGKLTVEQGKRLAMTMTVLGAEVARLEANQEEVYIVEKLDKVYAKQTIAEMAQKLGMQDEACYEALEALVLGRIFIPGKGYAKANSFNQMEWSELDEQGNVVGTYTGKGYLLNYTIDAKNNLIQTEVVVPEKGATFTWGYADFQPVNEQGYLPGVEKLRGAAGSKDLSLQFSISNPQLSKKGISAFKPEGYKEVSFEELVTIVKNMR